MLPPALPAPSPWASSGWLESGSDWPRSSSSASSSPRAYSLELFGGRLHTDITFGLAWGAFPVLVGYYAQAETLRLAAVAAASSTYTLSRAQRSLSTPARTLRRRVATVEGTITHNDGHTTPLSASVLLAPLEAALKATAWGVAALAVALIVYRTT